VKKFGKFMRGYKKECVIAPLFKMLEAFFDLLVPLVMAAIIDKGIASGDSVYILKLCGVLIALGIIGLLCSITAQYFAAKAAVGFSTELRHALFSHIQLLGFAEMDTVGTSTLITRMTSDINQVQNGINMFLRLFLRSPFVVFGSMIMAFFISRKAAWIFVVAIPLLAVVVFGIMLWTMPMYKKVQGGLDRVLGITRENLTGVRVVRAFHREEAEKEQFCQANEELTRLQLAVGKISSVMNPVTYVIVNLAIIAILYQGAIQVNIGALQQGDVVALVNYMSQILVELVKLANLIILVTKAIACANRVQSVMDMDPEMEFGVERVDIKEETEEAVAFEQVGFAYKGAGAESISDINFCARKGETIGVIGGTGSGKSTLISLIPRFYDATRGRVRIFGVDIKKYPKEQLRERIGVVQQKAQLFSGTIRSNLLWGNPDAQEEKLWEALRMAQAEEFVRGKKLGLDDPVEQEGRNLSGGQRQRLTIARALVAKPDILILDDSASALDFATDAALRKAIAALEGEMTVFIVSQRASSLQHADRILVLDDGELCGIGTHEELLEGCLVYREIYESQFKKAGEA
jgi:ATP-binding cassette subfamily B multidrug efflux pump